MKKITIFIVATISIFLAAFTVYSVQADENKPPEIVSSFSTKFNRKLRNRTFNLRKAASQIDGKVLLPGQTFSFNETVGNASKQNGYKKAQIFVNGKKRQGYGGGICQISSTLYNACLNAGMRIDERHSHSRRVDYVERGKDAATSYEGYDFKFTNTLSFPILIRITVKNNYVTADLSKIYTK